MTLITSSASSVTDQTIFREVEGKKIGGEVWAEGQEAV